MACRSYYREATGRRIGTQLDVNIRFRGTDADGNAWNDEWISVVRISKDLKDEARRIEKALYGVAGYGLTAFWQKDQPAS